MGKNGILGWATIFSALIVSAISLRADPLDVLLNQSIQRENESQQQQLEGEAPIKTQSRFGINDQVFTDYRFVDTRSKIGGGTNLSNGVDLGLDWLYPASDAKWDIQTLFSFNNAKSDQAYGVSNGNNVGGSAKATYTFFGCESSEWQLKGGPGFVYSGGDVDRPTANGTTSSLSDAYTIQSFMTVVYRTGTAKPTKEIPCPTIPKPWTAWHLTPSYDYTIQSTERIGESTAGKFTTEFRGDEVFSEKWMLYGKAAWVSTVNNDPTAGVEATYPNWGKFAAGVTFTPTPKFPISLEYALEAFNPTYERQTVTLTISYPFGPPSR